jgi:hypothetical protein
VYSDGSPSQTGEQPSITTPVKIGPNVQYLNAAAVIDVRFDRLEYLISHHVSRPVVQAVQDVQDQNH